jgi:competence protein ComEC
VGQGDANLVDLPDGSLLLIDGGGAPEGGADPGERVVLPALRARRRARVDIVVLTHPHPDHFGGLLAVLREVEVGELWDTGQGQAHGAGPIYKELLATARARNIPIRRPASLCDKPRQFREATLRVLAPCPAFVDGRGANDNSFVFSITFGRRSFLFTGDAEHIEEQELVQKHRAELRADVLKIGHHGSRTSSGAELLAAVSPSIATISCGTRNRFGHPTPEVLTRLAAFGVRALRTDRDGGIRVCTDGSSLTRRTSYSPVW